MLHQTKSLQCFLAAALGTITLNLATAQPSLAKDYADEETTTLLKVLGNAKLSLADGVRQVSKGGEAAISAKSVR